MKQRGGPARALIQVAWPGISRKKKKKGTFSLKGHRVKNVQEGDIGQTLFMSPSAASPDWE